MLNWRVRYHRLIEANPELHDPSVSVVEVGSAKASLANFLGRPVTVVDPAGGAAALPNLTIAPGNLLALPFSDGQADVVVCVDNLAPLAPAHRVAAIAELLRVARRKVLISCPCHKWAFEGERQLEASLTRLGITTPDWLARHLRNGLPDIQHILAPIIASNFEFEVSGNETMTQHYAAIALDFFYPHAKANDRQLFAKAGWQPPIEGNPWDYYYSFMFTIDKTRVRRAARAQNTGRPAAPSSPPRCQIYAVYHKNLPTAHLRGITPIFIGHNPREKPPQAIDASDSLDNRRWSELSAMYHVWKHGERSEIVGFCHYRRLFDFGAGPTDIRQINVPWAQAETFQSRMFDPQIISQCAAGAIITAMPFHDARSVFEHYCVCHNTQDYLSVFSDACIRHPELSAGLMEQFESKSLYAANLFIMSWALFDEICTIWMDVLTRFADRHPERLVGAYQTRDLSFLSERIFDAWLRAKRASGMKFIELPILFMH